MPLPLPLVVAGGGVLIVEDSFVIAVDDIRSCVVVVASYSYSLCCLGLSAGGRNEKITLI